MPKDALISAHLPNTDSSLTANAGIYIHIPFCIKKCPYCDFFSISDTSSKKIFIAALLREIELRSNPELLVDTIYFGGGTPSILSCEEVEKVLIAINKNFKLLDSKDLQITMEVNPGTVKDGYFQEIREVGINRLSIGVQSFQDAKLSFLGRIHSANEARQTIISARDFGFSDIGIDLMYCTPEEREAIWVKDLEIALEYSPEHLSCYMLSYEPDTPMFAAYSRGEIKSIDDGSVAELFRLTSKYLISKGFYHYEISNFASAPEHQSIHNKKYWNMVPYLGFGPSAHSYSTYLSNDRISEDNRVFERFWNIKNVDSYISMLSQSLMPIAEREILTDEQRLVEMIMVGLRTSHGIDIKSFEKLYKATKLYQTPHAKRADISDGVFINIFSTVLEQLEKREWGKLEKGVRCRLTTEGWLFMDTIAQWFVELI